MKRNSILNQKWTCFQKKNQLNEKKENQRSYHPNIYLYSMITGSGALTGPAATYGLQQLGLGKKPRRRKTGKPPQHGSGPIVYRTQPYPVKQKPMTGGS